VSEPLRAPTSIWTTDFIINIDTIDTIRHKPLTVNQKILYIGSYAPVFLLPSPFPGRGSDRGDAKVHSR